MFNEMLQGLQGDLTSDLIKIPGFKTNQIDDVFKIAGGEVTKQISGHMLSGNMGTIMNLFSNQPNSNEANGLEKILTSSITSQLVSKLGMNQTVATSVVGVILPAIMNKVTHINSQTPDDDSSPLQDLFGGGNSNIGGLLNKLF